MDPGIDADGTVPCGLNGNPVRLGVGVDNLRSCLGATDYLHWGVMSHEIGHNFMSGSQRAFADLITPLANKTTFIEGIATFLGFAAQEELLRIPSAYGLQTLTVSNMSRNDIPLTPAFDRAVFFPELAAFEAHPDFANAMTADIFAAILIHLYDEFGPHFAFRFFSAFVPAEQPLDFNLANEGQALAFWAAACSAAAGTDLKERFQTRWALPLDSSFYDTIYPKVVILVARREGGIFSDCLTTPRGPDCGSSFYTVTPCRVADTRDPNGPQGGPALSAGTPRTFMVAGRCEIPPTASSVSVNVTVTQPATQGHLTLFPVGSSPPLTSTINYRAGQTRANNAIVPLGSGYINVVSGQPSGTVHFILDVNGYFE
jgi:hypothetical protein